MNISNKERYFSLVEKYWFDQDWYRQFKTLDDSIDALKFANKINNKALYWLVFMDMDRFWYDKAFEKYQDKTFQVYFLKVLLEDFAVNNMTFFITFIWKLTDFRSYLKDIKILKIINYINNDNRTFILYNKVVFWKNIDFFSNLNKEFNKKIDLIDWVNNLIIKWY